MIYNYIKSKNISITAIDGILLMEDFTLVQTLMEVYAKCMLYDIKINH